MRHAFQILEQLGAECDRLGVRVVDVHGESGPASEFLAKIVHYIEARERECDRPALTDAEREAVERARQTLDAVQDLSPTATADDAMAAATLRGLLERTR
jgi:hypothetical protein